MLTFLSYHERHDGNIAIIKAIWQRKMSKKADGVLGYIIQAISSKQMDIWLNCDCASFSWNIFFWAKLMTSTAREVTILSALEKFSKEKKLKKPLAHLAYPNECSLKNHEDNN